MIAKTYLIHPYETGGNTIQENRADEERIVKELKEKGCSLYLVRPFKKIPETMKRRNALRMGKKLLKKCSSVLLTGNWKNSKGCIDEFIQAASENKTIFEYKENEIFLLTDKAIKEVLNGIKR